MFISGLLAFLQSTFIPGFLLLKYTGFLPGNENNKITKIQALVYGFGLSLLTNYLLVFGLTAAGLYKPITLYIILLIEAILLLYHLVYRSKIPAGGGYYRYVTLDINRYISAVKQFIASRSSAYNFLLFLSFGVILVYFFYFFYFLGTVFMHWDPAIAWNRFAEEWAANQIPVNTWRYPQLIPANWSVSYVMMQTTAIQCFARSIMPLFSISILLLFLDLGLRKKRAAYLLALIFFGIILGYLYDPSLIVSGYVDIAVSFFAFLSFHAMYRRLTWPAVVFASAAAVTKQSGLFILAVILVWALWAIFRDNKTNQKFLRGPGAVFSKRAPGRRRQSLFVSVLLLLLTVLIVTSSWYILKEIHIRKGIDRSEIQMVQSVHRSGSYTGRLEQGIRQILARRHPALKFTVYAALLLIMLGLFHKQSRRVTLFIVIPYSLMWGFLFSYDMRNLALAVPFMAFSAAFGAAFLKKMLPESRKIPQFKLSVIPLIIAVLTVLVVMNETVFKKEILIRHQNRQKIKMGDYQLNQLLYQYHKKEGIKGKIATNYSYLKLLPDLKKFYFQKSGRITPAFLDYLGTEKGKEIHYLLMPVVLKSEKKIYQRFREKLKNNEYRLVFKCKGYRFVQVRFCLRRPGGSFEKLPPGPPQNF